MTYTKDTTIGEVTTYEVFEGTPEEILQLISGMPQELKGGELGRGNEVLAVPNGAKYTMAGDKMPSIIVNTGSENLDVEKVSKKIQKHISKSM